MDVKRRNNAGRVAPLIDLHDNIEKLNNSSVKRSKYTSPHSSNRRLFRNTDVKCNVVDVRYKLEIVVPFDKTATCCRLITELSILHSHFWPLSSSLAFPILLFHTGITEEEAHQLCLHLF